MSNEKQTNGPDAPGVGSQTPGYVSKHHICPHCKEEIPVQMVQQGGLHMNCHEAEIDVWFVALPEAPKHGFYENDINSIVSMLNEDMEGPYLIEKQSMKAGLFYNLPEFDGF